MKKKSVYRRKLIRALRSVFKELDTLQSYTVHDACKRICEISYTKRQRTRQRTRQSVDNVLALNKNVGRGG